MARSWESRQSHDSCSVFWYRTTNTQLLWSQQHCSSTVFCRIYHTRYRSRSRTQFPEAPSVHLRNSRRSWEISRFSELQHLRVHFNQSGEHLGNTEQYLPSGLETIFVDIYGSILSYLARVYTIEHITHAFASTATTKFMQSIMNDALAEISNRKGQFSRLRRLKIAAHISSTLP